MSLRKKTKILGESINKPINKPIETIYETLSVVNIIKTLIRFRWFVMGTTFLVPFVLVLILLLIPQRVVVSFSYNMPETQVSEFLNLRDAILESPLLKEFEKRVSEKLELAYPSSGIHLDLRDFRFDTSPPYDPKKPLDTYGIVQISLETKSLPITDELRSKQYQIVQSEFQSIVFRPVLEETSNSLILSNLQKKWQQEIVGVINSLKKDDLLYGLYVDQIKSLKRLRRKYGPSAKSTIELLIDPSNVRGKKQFERYLHLLPVTQQIVALESIVAQIKSKEGHSIKLKKGLDFLITHMNYLIQNRLFSRKAVEEYVLKLVRKKSTYESELDYLKDLSINILSGWRTRFYSLNEEPRVTLVSKGFKRYSVFAFIGGAFFAVLTALIFDFIRRNREFLES